MGPYRSTEIENQTKTVTIKHIINYLQLVSLTDWRNDWMNDSGGKIWTTINNSPAYLTVFGSLHYEQTFLKRYSWRLFWLRKSILRAKKRERKQNILDIFCKELK
jgi:hypothetical protein